MYSTSELETLRDAVVLRETFSPNYRPAIITPSAAAEIIVLREIARRVAVRPRTYTVNEREAACVYCHVVNAGSVDDHTDRCAYREAHDWRTQYQEAIGVD